jgi:hypothetical protein
MTKLKGLPAISGLGNPRHRRFVLEYLATNLHGAEAARRAGYSPKSARVQASTLLANPNIARAVQEGYRVAMEEASARSESVVMDWKALVQRDSEIATFDPSTVVAWDDGKMQIKPMSLVPKSARQCISSIRETARGLIVTFVNPHPSLDRLTRHHGILSGARPVEAVSVQEQQQSDYDKAQVAADWLERMSASLKTTDVGDVVKALRKAPDGVQSPAVAADGASG